MSETSTSSSTSNRYRNYVLFMLTMAYVFNFIDRQILVILQESIKLDLNLSDTQLGLLSGFTFAIFYVTMGIPIARLADRSNRKNIIAISLSVWSAMTAVSGTALNFVQLLLARIGVGVGEAGASPPAHAMISDYFKPEKRATALSIYSTGIYIGIIVGYPLGGWLDTMYGWRVALYSLGLPGILFALIFYFTVKEPKRGVFDRKPAGDAISFKSVLQILFSKKSFVLLAAATGIHTFCLYGMGNWMPSFLIRNHGMTIQEVGLWSGIIVGLGGAIGTFLGGIVADRLGKKDKTWYFKVSAYGALISLPFLAVVLLSSSAYVVIGAQMIVYIFWSTYLGPSIAITHSMVPPQMRAFSSAILFLVLNLVGLGFGPLVIGMLSDAFSGSFEENSLRMALSFTFITSITAIVLFLKAGNKVTQDLQLDD